MVTTNQTIVKDKDFNLNGKVEFGGDGFLRKIAVQPGTYRDRGVTAYDVGFYNTDSANAGGTLTFEDGERIIDESGNEWTLNANKNRLQKRDYNGAIIEPKEEIAVTIPKSEKIKVDLGVGGATDAKGDYTVKITDQSGSHTYTYTATGDSTNSGAGYATSADEIFNDDANDKGLIWQIKQDYPNLVTRSGDTITLNPGKDSPMAIAINDTDYRYTMTATNESEADGTNQSKKGTYELTVPSLSEGRILEAKHNYFDDLNRTINALDGYSTKLDGTKGPVASDDLVDSIVRTGLDQSTKQFEATNVGHGELGGRNAVFNVSYDKITTQETHYNILIQDWGGADLSKLAMESQSLNMTYQALYSTISKTNQLSLVNFLK